MIGKSRLRLDLDQRISVDVWLEDGQLHFSAGDDDHPDAVRQAFPGSARLGISVDTPRHTAQVIIFDGNEILGGVDFRGAGRTGDLPELSFIRPTGESETPELEA